MRPSRVSTLVLLFVLPAVYGFAQTPTPNATQNHGVSEGISPARNPLFQPLGDSTTVALHNGEAIHRYTDIAIAGRKIGLTFERVYRSQVTYDGPFGHGWSHNFDQWVLDDGQGNLRHIDGGRMARDVYPGLGSQSLLSCSTPGVYRKARSLSSGEWEIRDRDGMIRRFHPLGTSVTAGRLKEIEDPFGNSISLEYDAGGRLSMIRDDLYDPTSEPSRFLLLGYVNNRISTITDVKNGRSWTYSYDGQGQLESVSSPPVETWTETGPVVAPRVLGYGYSDDITGELAHNLTTVTYPGQTLPRLNIGYNVDDHVETVEVGAPQPGGTAPAFHFDYQPSSLGGLHVIQTTVTDRAGHVTTYHANVTGQALSIVDASSHTRTLVVNADGEITRKINPEGDQIDVTFASTPDRFQQGNALVSLHTPAPGRPGSVKPYRVRANYDPVYNRALTTVSRGGSVVLDYEENPQLVAVLIADWGIITPTIVPLGDINGDGVVNQFGGNTIRRRAAPVTKGLPTGTTGPVIKEHYYTFDGHGRVLSHANPEGTLTAYTYRNGYLESVIRDLDPDPANCPNSAGAYPNAGTANWTKDCSIPHVQAKSSFLRDGRGNVLEVTDPRGVKTTFEYNALDEIRRITDASGVDPATLDPHLTTLVNLGYSHLVAPSIVTEYEYDATGRMVRMLEDNRGAGDPGNPVIETRVAYDLEDRPTSVAVRLTGQEFATTTMVYDANGNRIRVTDAEGRTNATVYDEQDRILQIHQGTDSTGQPIATTSTITYGYDKNGLRTSAEGPEDLDGDSQLEKTLTLHDGKNRIHAIITATGTETILGYHARGWLETTTTRGSLGGPSKNLNDTTGNVTLSVNTSEFDALGRVVKSRDGLFVPGQTPTPAGPETDFRHDRHNNVVERFDPSGNRVVYVYDGLDRPIEIRDALGNTYRYTYDAGGNVVETERTDADPFGGAAVVRRTLDTYDGRGYRIRSVFEGDVSYYAYDAQGNLTARTDGNSQVVAPDPLGRYTAGNLPSTGNTRRFVSIRNSAGLLQTVRTDLWPNGKGSGTYDIWAPGFDPSIDPPGVLRVERSSIQYDRVGNVVSTTSESGRTLLFEYDDHHRMTTKTFPDGSYLSYDYYRNGSLRRVALYDRFGQKYREIENHYDADGRFRSRNVVHHPWDYEGTITQEFEWNGLDLTTRSADLKLQSEYLASTVVRTYDSLGRELTDDQNGQVTTSSHGSYYPSGMTFPSGGRSLQFGFDARGRIQSIQEAGGGPTVAAYEYFGSTGGIRANVAEIVYGNGTRKSYQTPPPGSGLSNGYSLDGYGVHLQHLDPTGSPLSALAYDHDLNGNRTTEVRLVGGTMTADTVVYDSKRRIELFQKQIDAVTQIGRAYAYSGDGDWTQFAMQAAPNPPSIYPFFAPAIDWAYESIALGSLEHDPAGNRIRDEWFDYKFDAFDRLVRIAARDGGPSILRFSYDTDTRRIEKRDEWQGDTTRYLYLGHRVIEEQDQDGNLRSQYVHGHWIDELVQWTTDSVTYYYLTDDNGNVVGLTDSSGNVVERVTYGPYGTPTFLDASGNVITDSSGLPVVQSPAGNRYLFQGRDYDHELALWKRANTPSSYFAESSGAGQYNFRFRYSDPEEGRFISRDPLSPAGNSSIDPSLLVGRILDGEGDTPYEQASNNPVNRLDPLGLSTVTFHGSDLTSGLRNMFLVLDDFSGGGEELYFMSIAKEFKLDVSARHTPCGWWDIRPPDPFNGGFNPPPYPDDGPLPPPDDPKKPKPKPDPKPKPSPGGGGGGGGDSRLPDAKGGNGKSGPTNPGRGGGPRLGGGGSTTGGPGRLPPAVGGGGRVIIRGGGVALGFAGTALSIIEVKARNLSFWDEITEFYFRCLDPFSSTTVAILESAEAADGGLETPGASYTPSSAELYDEYLRISDALEKATTTTKKRPLIVKLVKLKKEAEAMSCGYLSRRYKYRGQFRGWNVFNCNKTPSAIQLNVGADGEEEDSEPSSGEQGRILHDDAPRFAGRESTDTPLSPSAKSALRRFESSATASRPEPPVRRPSSLPSILSLLLSALMLTLTHFGLRD